MRILIQGEDMCGITGYIGPRNAPQIILSSLKQLEYRGYDSAGIAVVSQHLIVEKEVGKLVDLEHKDGIQNIKGTVGIGHTRWATHGKPCKKNAHPHTDCEGKYAVVHNGIIENFDILKQELVKNGHKFSSDTDTEVIAHLIESSESKPLLEKVKDALKKLKGSYAIAVISAEEPNRIIAARKESPLVIGIGKGEYFLGSDVTAFLKYTKDVVFLNDGEIAEITRESYQIYDINTGKTVDKTTVRIKWSAEMAEKSGYEHFMLKEIYEQPHSLRETLRSEREVERAVNYIKDAERLYIIACGTSYHAGLMGKYFIEKWCHIPVEVIVASEFYSSVYEVIDEKCAVITISQSGETADTLIAVKEIKKHSIPVLAVTNVVGSSLTRISDAVCYTHAGPEIGVAATKTFTAQILIMIMIAVNLYKSRYLHNTKLKNSVSVSDITSSLQKLPEIVDRIIHKYDSEISKLASRLYNFEDFYYLGRGAGYPLALEGALKLKELSYIHGEGMPGGELKHGTLALIEDDVPVVAIVVHDRSYEKMLGNIMEVKSRGAYVITISEENDSRVEEISDIYLPIEKIPVHLAAICYIIPLQLFAYYIAVIRGKDPDKPRNLAKSVTVE